MYIHLSRHELLTTLSALQQGRAYRRNSKRYIRKSVENGVITEEFAAERIAHAEMICGRNPPAGISIGRQDGRRTRITGSERLT